MLPKLVGQVDELLGQIVALQKIARLKRVNFIRDRSRRMDHPHLVHVLRQKSSKVFSGGTARQYYATGYHGALSKYFIAKPVLTFTEQLRKVVVLKIRYPGQCGDSRKLE